MLRRIYDWVLSWAEHPAGTWALVILSFAESSFFPIPPDVLLIALAIGKPRRAFWFGLACSAASIVGGTFGYLLGSAFWYAVSDLFFTYVPGFTQARFGQIQAMYEAYNFWIVFTAGFTPLPYKIFTVSAGVFNVSFPMFLLASAVSRTARFMLVSTLIYFFGPPIKAFIDKYFNLAAIAFTVLLIAGFAVIKYAL